MKIDFIVLTSAVIAVCALISVLYGLIHLSIRPVRKDLERLEKEFKAFKVEVRDKFEKILDRLPKS